MKEFFIEWWEIIKSGAVIMGFFIIYVLAVNVLVDLLFGKDDSN